MPEKVPTKDLVGVEVTETIEMTVVTESAGASELTEVSDTDTEEDFISEIIDDVNAVFVRF